MKQLLLRGLSLLLTVALTAALCGCGAPASGKPEDGQTAATAADTPDTPTAGTLPAETEPEITQGKHQREPDYPSVFDVYSLSLGDCTVSLHQQLYTEELLRRDAEILRQDLDTLLAFTGAEEPDLQVTIVPSIPNGHSRVADHRIFCTQEELESGAYRHGLVQAVCGLSRYWQSVGLADYVFGQWEDTEDLKAWYRDPAHGNQLSLAPPYFSPVFADPETIRMSEAAARSVTAHFLEQEGYEAFRQLDRTRPAVEAWAEVALETPIPALPAGADAADRLKVLSFTSTQLVLKADEPMNRFRWELTATDWLTDAEGVYQMLCSFYSGYPTMLETMEQRLPESFPLVRERAEQEFRIVMVMSNNPSFVKWGSDRIELAYGASLWHEVIHQLLPISGGATEKSWEAEGVAEHYSRPISRGAGTGMQEGRYRYLTDRSYLREVPGIGEDDLTFQTLVIQAYTAVSPLPEAPEDLDQLLFERSIAAVGLLHPELQQSNGSAFFSDSVGATDGITSGPREQDGNGLTYPEATLMVEYLMDRFGEDAYVTGYLSDQSMEARFGASYPALYADFLEWVRETFEPGGTP